MADHAHPADDDLYVGKPIRAVELGRYLSGRGQYVDDLALPGMLYAAFLRRKEEWLNNEALQQEKFDKRLAEEEAWLRRGVKARRKSSEAIGLTLSMLYVGFALLDRTVL